MSSLVALAAPSNFVTSSLEIIYISSSPSNAQESSSRTLEVQGKVLRTKDKRSDFSTLPPPSIKRGHDHPRKRPIQPGESRQDTTPDAKRKRGPSRPSKDSTANGARSKHALPSRSLTAGLKRYSKRLQEKHDHGSSKEGYEKGLEVDHIPTVLSQHTVWRNKMDMLFYGDTTPVPTVVPRGTFGKQPGYEGGSYVVRHNERTYKARRQAFEFEERAQEYDDSTDVEAPLEKRRTYVDCHSPEHALGKCALQYHKLIEPSQDLKGGPEYGLDSSLSGARPCSSTSNSAKRLVK
jgi:hypothetical protein